MSYRGGPGGGGAPRVKKVMTQAINLMFEFLKNREKVQIWLYENTTMKIEGIIIVSVIR
jgi:small nuclear ribonucleoprotein E